MTPKSEWQLWWNSLFLTKHQKIWIRLAIFCLERANKISPISINYP